MSDTKRLIAAAFLVAVIAATSACTTGRVQPTPTPMSSVPSASSTSTTTTTTSGTTSSAPPTLSPAAQDLKDAEQTVPRFWTVLDTLASDPKLSLDGLATVSRDQAIGQWRSILTGYRERGWKKVGRSTVASVEATTADGKTFAVRACIDVSKANLVDSEGKSVVTAARLDRAQYNYHVQKAPQGFFVTEDKLEANPC
jgi:hypothetical protein